MILTTPDLPDLMPSWIISLQSANRSKSTIRVYRDGVTRFLAHCAERGIPAVLDRRTVEGWLAAALASGQEPATVRLRQTAVRQFSKWLEAEGEIEFDRMAALTPVPLDSKVVMPLTTDDMTLLIKACAGTRFIDRRDMAALRLLLETGCRAGEIVNLELADVDLVRGIAIVRRGKGGKGRVVPFGPQTAQALDRYLRARKLHRVAATSVDLFLGDRGRKSFGYEGLRKALSNRAETAGVQGFHIHLTRHTMANRWLEKGGSESGLMAVAGWSQPNMLQRYTKQLASQRANTEARTLNLGDI